MKTGCLFSARGAGRVAISRSVPKFLKGKIAVYEKLAPPAWMVRITDREKWCRCYRKVVLGELNPLQVYNELHALAGEGNEPILLCYERLEDPDEWCHRRLVAEWFREKLGIDVDEFGREPKDEAPPAQLDLFAA
jgi:uncharacterized protein (DUF488 family)